MAPVLRDWVPEGDLAHFVADLVDGGALDLAAIYDDYAEERGFPPYDPRLMVKLLRLRLRDRGDVVAASLSARATGMWRCGCCAPISIRTSARSLASASRHLAALGDLFVQSLRLCRQAELVGLGVLAVDGTKLRANASRHKAMSYERMLEREAELEVRDCRLARAGRRVAGRCARPPTRPRTPNTGIGEATSCPPSFGVARIAWRGSSEAKQALEAQARGGRGSPARADGRAGQAAAPAIQRDRDPFAPKPKAQRNFTDPDSKIMKTSDGAFHQCYNGQLIVDSATQVIVACDAFDAAPDAQLLEPMLDQLAENLAAIDATLPDGAALLGDAGYLSEHNLLITQAHDLDAHLAAGRVKHTDPPAPTPPEPSPEHATAGQLMARKLTERRPAPRSTRDARRSSNPSSARCRPSRTPASSGCAASPPPAPNIASKAPCTTSGDETARRALRRCRPGAKVASGAPG